MLLLLSYLSTRGGKLSDPMALCGFSFCRSFLTPLTDISILGILGKSSSPIDGKEPSGSTLKADLNYLFKFFAFCTASTKSLPLSFKGTVPDAFCFSDFTYDQNRL